MILNAQRPTRYNLPHFHGVGPLPHFHGIGPIPHFQDVGTSPRFHGIGIFYDTRCTTTSSIQPSTLPRCRTLSTLPWCRNPFLKISKFLKIPIYQDLFSSVHLILSLFASTRSKFSKCLSFRVHIRQQSFNPTFSKLLPFQNYIIITFSIFQKLHLSCIVFHV